ncbi:cupin domain-containing protein [Algoriphagus mannitolivorans]|uniref:cupin domain-containing protein n=1 Tax=Algoriphagus mannitolivorans TaxID=226504 RepID=UPI00041F3D19|nr:cupin domain-containing protein [Algoriphagus mannitolivorans]
MKSSYRISELIELLNLQEHPEGGFYSETYRAKESTTLSYGERSLATSIYFLLRSEDVSRFHRIKSDELWFWHEGSPLSVHILTHEGHKLLKLGPVNKEDCRPFHLVPKNTIFGSTVDDPNSYALVSCVVSPGFDFEDFELFTRKDLIDQYPGHSEIIQKLT